MGDAVTRTFLLCLLLCLGLLQACVRQIGTEDIEVMRAGSLEWQADEDIARVVYVGVCDESARIPELRSLVLSWLERQYFSVTDNPSKAGYIVQISLLGAGPVDPDRLRAVVEAGYGSPARLSGTGATALLADILLVQRHIPSHKRPSRERMKNASRRNAVDSSQMRIGLLVRYELREDVSLPGSFAEVLGRELSRGIFLPDAPPEVSQAPSAVTRPAP